MLCLTNTHNWYKYIYPIDKTYKNHMGGILLDIYYCVLMVGNTNVIE